MRIFFLSFFVLASFNGAFAAEADVKKDLDCLKAIGPEGTGNKEASAAWKALTAHGIDALIPTLEAMDDAKPVPANWLRLAAQAIFENAQHAKKPRPANQLETFVKDSHHSPAARRLAYELLVEADPKASARLLPGMIDDPSVEIRHDAIAAAVEKATPLIKSDPKQAAAEFRKLFDASRERGQTEAIAKILKELKVDVDLNDHFGVVSDWMLLGPFDSTGGAGFAKPYEPESKVDLGAGYKSKTGADIKWLPQQSTGQYGEVDLNEALGKHKDAAAYAFAVIDAAKEMPVELRFSSITAIKVYLNGKEIYAREEYHHGQRFDQYAAMGMLKAGRNEILLKICQNNQTDSWAQAWKFQLRLCDATGGAVPVKVVTTK